MDINSILPVILGVIVGYGLQAITEFRKESGDRNALRTLLKIEIKNNGNYLKILHNKLLWDAKSHDELTLADQLTNIELIQIKNPLWLNKTTLFAQALNEKEINVIENFYQFISEIIKIQLDLIKFKKIETGIILPPADMGRIEARNIFTSNADCMWKDYHEKYFTTISLSIDLVNHLESKSRLFKKI